MKLGFLASGGGSSMRAIVSAIEAGTLDADARLVVSNKADAPALTFAQIHGLPTRVIPTARSPTEADERLCAALEAVGADLVILSGYLRRLGPKTLYRFHERVLNIHPSLLPRHGGLGMYGRRVHEAVLASGDAVSGATVHLVDEDYDHGATVAQVEVPVLPGDQAVDLERRVMTAEPALFVETLQRLAAGGLRIGGHG